MTNTREREEAVATIATQTYLQLERIWLGPLPPVEHEIDRSTWAQYGRGG